MIVPGLLNGRASFGVEYRPTNGPREIYAITGVNQVDGDGLPRFDSAFARIVVHEFNHAWANALIDEHRASFAQFGDALYRPVADRMRRLAYGSWESMLYEALVRAAVVRYVADHDGDDAARAEIATQSDLGFVWAADLDTLLRRYPNDRTTYPSLRAFMPRVVDFFRNAVSPSQRR